MIAFTKTALAAATLLMAAQASAQITFYEHEGFDGRSFTTQSDIWNFGRAGFNDRASSVVVSSARWEVCDRANFGGRCVVLRRGQYGSLAAMGLDDRVSSVRSLRRNARVDDDRYAPPPVVAYDYRRRPSERLYEAPVTSVRAVVGTPERRCWIEREQVVQRTDRGEPNVGGAIAGAVIGGILGHQIGGGSGRDAATAVGVVGGAAVGANAGRVGSGERVVTQDVRRCTSAPPQARPDYWDVTYHFRGQDHRVQMTTPPRDYIVVNQQGEPRVG